MDHLFKQAEEKAEAGKKRAAAPGQVKEKPAKKKKTEGLGKGQMTLHQMFKKQG
jgi:hypothetical protein